MKHVFGTVIVLFVVCLSLLQPAPRVLAQSGAAIVVTAATDDLETNGNCTLREAIQAANTDTPQDACPAGNGADVIQLGPGGYILSLAGRGEDENQTGDLDILEDVVIQGSPGPASEIFGGFTDRVFHILPEDVQVRISGVLIAQGEITASQNDPQTDFSGAGIWNNGRLVLDQVTLRENRGDGYGGGIYNAGELWMDRSSISFMEMRDAAGGAIYNHGSLRVTQSEFDNNHLEDGTAGTIFNDGTAVLQDCRLLGFPGGRPDIDTHDSGGGLITNLGTMTIERCNLGQAQAGFASHIWNQGDLTLIQSTVEGGTTLDGRNESILSTGSLTLTETTVGRNQMRAIRGSGALRLFASTLQGNQSSTTLDLRGGGGILFDGTVVISNTLIADNLSFGLGGGLSGSGDWEIAGSSVWGNEVLRAFSGGQPASTALGGGIVWRSGRLQIENSTISVNDSNQAGGGLFVQGGEVQLNHVTVARNRVKDGEGGGLAYSGGQTTLHNTLLADNHVIALEPGVPPTPDCYAPAQDPLTGQAQSGSLLSAGYNLIGVLSSCSLAPGPGDQIGSPETPVEPWLLEQSAAEAGGPTPAQILLPFSPAIDAGDPAGCPAVDQRGRPRPQGQGCDIGAIEYDPHTDPFQVQIDVRPLNAANPVDPSGNGQVPVAILTTPGFFAPQQVDPTSLTFGRSGQEGSQVEKNGWPVCLPLDANRDRRLDLVCLFWANRTGLQPGDQTAILRGWTRTGRPFVGIDPVQVPAPGAASGAAYAAAGTGSEDVGTMGDALRWLPAVMK